MRTRQLRKARGRETGEGFTPIMGQLHKSGMNRLARRGAAAGWGRSLKGGVNWRKKQWVWAMRLTILLLTIGFVICCLQFVSVGSSRAPERQRALSLSTEGSKPAVELSETEEAARTDKINGS
jgi:hypothetical protein